MIRALYFADQESYLCISISSSHGSTEFFKLHSISPRPLDTLEACHYCKCDAKILGIARDVRSAPTSNTRFNLEAVRESVTPSITQLFRRRLSRPRRS